MGSIAVQTAVGEIGSKATTELSYSFASLVNMADRFQYGAGPNGLYLLNTEDQYTNDDVYERYFILASTDLGVDSFKKGRFAYLEFEAEFPFTLSVKFDNQDWQDYEIEPDKTGLQGIRIPIDKKPTDQGFFVTFKVSSLHRFTLSKIKGTFFVRPGGVKGY